jgi:hypothetical protein
MSKPGMLLVLIVSIFFCSTLPVWADLGSFKDSVEDAEKKEKKPDPPKREKPQNKNSYDDDEDEHTLLFFFFRLWALGNLTHYYTDYPYDGYGYIRRDYLSYPDEKNEDKYHYFTTGLSGFYLDDLGSGSWFSFNGNIFKFFGPYADVYVIYDGHETLTGLRAGIQFSLIQTNPFTVNLYYQGQWWFGMMERSGSAAGLEFLVYPFRPISLKAKTGFQVFDNFEMGEIELEAGVMLASWQIYAGWRWWNIDGESWSGPFAGLRKFF